MSSQAHANTPQVPVTVNKQNIKEVNVGTLSENDLQSLKKQDPFMYHSIPGVHEAELHFKPVNRSDLINPSSSHEEESFVVFRKSRLSTECHASLLLDEALLEIEDESFDPNEFHQDFDELNELIKMLTGNNDSSDDGRQAMQ